VKQLSGFELLARVVTLDIPTEKKGSSLFPELAIEFPNPLIARIICRKVQDSNGTAQALSFVRFQKATGAVFGDSEFNGFSHYLLCDPAGIGYFE
jgi:hypothetical protein